MLGVCDLFMRGGACGPSVRGARSFLEFVSKCALQPWPRCSTGLQRLASVRPAKRRGPVSASAPRPESDISFLSVRAQAAQPKPNICGPACIPQRSAIACVRHLQHRSWRMAASQACCVVDTTAPGSTSLPGEVAAIVAQRLKAVGLPHVVELRPLPRGAESVLALDLPRLTKISCAPAWALPSTLVELVIERCPELRSVADVRWDGLPALRLLRIRDCGLEHPLHASILRCACLQSIDLAGNAMTNILDPAAALPDGPDAALPIRPPSTAAPRDALAALRPAPAEAAAARPGQCLPVRRRGLSVQASAAGQGGVTSASGEDQDANGQVNDGQVTPSAEGSTLLRLTSLSLARNHLRNLPIEMIETSSASLSSLDLADNLIATLDPSIGSATRLQSLDLSRNCLLTLPDAVGALALLETIRLRGNKELTSLPRCLAGCTSLRRIQAAGSGLDAVSPALADLPQLRELELTGCPLRTERLRSRAGDPSGVDARACVPQGEGGDGLGGGGPAAGGSGAAGGGADGGGSLWGGGGTGAIGSSSGFGGDGSKRGGGIAGSRTRQRWQEDRRGAAAGLWSVDTVRRYGTSDQPVPGGRRGIDSPLPAAAAGAEGKSAGDGAGPASGGWGWSAGGT